MNTKEPININAESFDIAVTKSPVPVVVDFWAPWCGPCKMLSPLLDEIAREQEGAVRVAKVNAADNPELASRFGVRAVPTLLFFNNGELRETLVGLTGKKNIVAKIEALAGSLKQNQQPEEIFDMSAKKIALITGANKGIGLETARQLAASHGVHVLIGARDAAKGAEAAAKLKGEGLDVEAITINVTDEKSIAAAAKTVADKFGHLDILINNAGVMLDDHSKKVSEQSLKMWRKTFDTNLFGLIAVTQAFLPLLKKSAAGRIVNLSSILGSIALHADPASPIYDFKLPAYNVSKSAVNAWTVQLAYELKDTKIKVNAVHPGWVKTDMGGDAAPMEIPDGAKTSVEMATIGADGPNGSYSHMGETLPW